MTQENLSEIELKMIQKIMRELAQNPTVIKLGWKDAKQMFERYLLEAALERNKDNPGAAADDLGMTHQLFRHHLRYSLGRFDLKFATNEKRVVRIKIAEIEETITQAEKKVAASEKLENIRQRKLRF